MLPLKKRRGEAEGDGADGDRCKGTEQPEGAARLDRVDLRRRDASWATANC